MKIAILVNEFPCRSETFITNQLTGLIERGLDIDVYASRGDDSALSDTSPNTSQLPSRIFYLNDTTNGMPSNKFKRFLNGVQLVRKGLQTGNGWLLRSLDIRKFGKKAACLELLHRSMIFASKKSYDIVHCHFGPNGQIGIALKDIGAIKGKVVTTFYGYDLSNYIQKNGRNVYDFLFAQGDLFIAISERMRDELIQLGCSSDKIIIHRLGVDLSRFRFCPRGKKTNIAKIRLLTVGRLVEKKGLEYGVRAVAQLAKKFPQVEYQIAGDGILRENLAQLIEQMNMTQHIRLLGWQAPEDVAKLMEDADIFLAPSVTSANGDQEGTPTVAIEALARGLPVLGTLHSGIPELVQDGVSGFLVPEKDTIALTQKLEYLIAHPEIWEGMGNAGRRWVEKYYDIHKLNNRLVTVYEHLLNGVPKQSREDINSDSPWNRVGMFGAF